MISNYKFSGFFSLQIRKAIPLLSYPLAMVEQKLDEIKKEYEVVDANYLKILRDLTKFVFRMIIFYLFVCISLSENSISQVMVSLPALRSIISPKTLRLKFVSIQENLNREKKFQMKSSFYSIKLTEKNKHRPEKVICKFKILTNLIFL